MKKMSYAEAIREAMSIRMREDPNVLLFGEDVGAFGGCFGVSAGMFDEFGEKRVRDTPISEGAIIGAAVGSAATGLRPIAELMFCDFLTVGMDQLVNQAAKMRYMFGGKISLPMVVRLPCGAGVGAAAQHSQSLEAWMTHVPGLKVVYPSTPQDALGLMLSSIDDDNPVMFFEHKAVYALKGDVESFEPIPLGKGDIKREGSDVTVIATGKMVYEALAAAEKLDKDDKSGLKAADAHADQLKKERKEVQDYLAGKMTANTTPAEALQVVKSYPDRDKLLPETQQELLMMEFGTFLNSTGDVDGAVLILDKVAELKPGTEAGQQAPRIKAGILANKDRIKAQIEAAKKAQNK
mgnify:CR=1 FL=1